MIISPIKGSLKAKTALVSLSNTAWIFDLFINLTTFKYYALGTLREAFSKAKHLFNKHLLSPYHVLRTGRTAGIKRRGKKQPGIFRGPE